MLVLGACSGERTSTLELTAVPVGQLRATQVVSGINGYSWMVGYTDGRDKPALYRFRDGQAEHVLDVGAWDHGVWAFAFGDSVILDGVRCATAACEGLVMELVAVAADGTATQWGVVDSKAGAPDDATSAAFVGRSASSFWIWNLSGKLLALDGGGRAAGGPIAPRPFSEPCVIGSELYLIEQEDPPPEPAPGEAVQVTSDPVGAIVSRWGPDGFAPVPGGRLPQAESPGPIAFCGREAFEVPGAAATARWEAGPGWTTAAPVGPPPDPVSALKESSSHRRYVVDSGGALLELSPAGPVDLGLRFTLQRGDGPPLGLLVDDANGQVVACLSKPDSDLECHVKQV